MTRRTRVALYFPALIGFLALLPPGNAQTPGGSAYEVASIKPSDPASRVTQVMYQPGGLFTAKGVTVQMLVMQAYDVPASQLSGGPAWLNTERYDISAKADATQDTDPRQMTEEQRKGFMERNRLRLQALLSDRFQLKVRRENKEMPVYVLTVGKGGSKLKVTPIQDADAAPNRMQGVRIGRGQFTATAAPMELLTRILSNQVGRPVIDRTGLTGSYDFVLEFTPEQGQELAPPPDAPPSGAAPGPSIFTAVQEQLGLKLDAQKNTAEVLVIDHAEKASAN